MVLILSHYSHSTFFFSSFSSLLCLYWLLVYTTYNADDDGYPDYLDLDSDGDGKMDVKEGQRDDDNDGIANWRDPNDAIITAGGAGAAGAAATANGANGVNSGPAASGANNNDATSSMNEEEAKCSPGVDGAPLCWWVWLLLLLLVCCCLFLLLFLCWRSKRPRIFVRLNQSGKNGKTKEDERLFVVYVANEHDSLGSVVIKLCENSKVPDDVAQALKFEKTLGLFHGGQAMTADTDHHLSDYGVLPLSSNTAPGRNKKQKALRMEAAILDIRKVMIQNPMAEYSPRTKISLMSRMSEKNRSTPFNALKNDDTQIKTLLKSGIGSMAHIEIPVRD